MIVEASGSDAAVSELFQIAGHNCRINIAGHTLGRQIPVEMGWTNWKTLRIKGASGTNHFMPRTIRFINQMRDTFSFEKLTTHYFKFEDIQKAFEVAMNDKAVAMKVMLMFDEN